MIPGSFLEKLKARVPDVEMRPYKDSGMKENVC
jgi:hypothetical protein